MPLLERIQALFAGVPELVEGGGPYVFWIFVSGVVLWTLVIERYWFFRRVLPARSTALSSRSGEREVTTCRGARGRFVRR